MYLTTDGSHSLIDNIFPFLVVHQIKDLELMMAHAHPALRQQVWALFLFLTDVLDNLFIIKKCQFFIQTNKAAL